MPDIIKNNYLKDTEKAFGDITGSYTELVDLGTEYLFRGMMIYSTLDQAVTLKFANAESDELNVPPNWEISPEVDFWHDGVIEIKHAGSAPTEGFLKMISWRAE